MTHRQTVGIGTTAGLRALAREAAVSASARVLRVGGRAGVLVLVGASLPPLAVPMAVSALAAAEEEEVSISVASTAHSLIGALLGAPAEGRMVISVTPFVILVKHSLPPIGLVTSGRDMV